MMKNTKLTFLFLMLTLSFMIASESSLQILGPQLKRRILEQQQIEIKSLNKATDPLLDIRLRAKHPEALRSAGFQIRSINGPFVTAYIPFSKLNELTAFPGVESIKEASNCYLHLDKSMPDIHMDLVHSNSGSTGYTGNNIIVGIIDTGIDWTHEDFIDEDGNTRILAIWDQTLDEPNEPFHIYTQIQIQAALDQKLFSMVEGKDVHGHGTHVAGIAAGNGRGTGNNQSSGIYIGGAPDASLLIVKVSDGVIMSDSQVEDGLNFIFQKADELEMPCVVNLSLGRRSGSHDGRDAFELGMNNYLSTPGHAIVVSAGNDGGKRIHVQHEFDPFIQDTLNVEFQVGENNAATIDQVSFEGWIHYLAPVSITVVNPQGDRFGPIVPDALYRWPENSATQVFVDNGSGGRYEYNGDKQILIQIMDGEQGDELLPGKWTIQFFNGSDRLDLWMVDHTLQSEITSEVNETMLLNEPAHALLVVAVGSYISRTQWPNLYSASWKPEGLTLEQLSSTSSPGPSRKNALDNQTPNKPEITAPGEYIVSSYSRWSDYWPGDPYMATDSVHRAWTGTSFAAPHVTGLIACMFEENPALSANTIKGKLLNARKDEFTGNDPWNEFWGFGKLDASKIMGITTVDYNQTSMLPDHEDLITNFPNPFNGHTMITIRFKDMTHSLTDENKLKIFDIRGKLVQAFNLPTSYTGEINIRWNGRNAQFREVPSGVYFIHLKNNKQYHTKKTILMR